MPMKLCPPTAPVSRRGAGRGDARHVPGVGLLEKRGHPHRDSLEGVWDADSVGGKKPPGPKKDATHSGPRKEYWSLCEPNQKVYIICPVGKKCDDKDPPACA